MKGGLAVPDTVNSPANPVASTGGDLSPRARRTRRTATPLGVTNATNGNERDDRAGTPVYRGDPRREAIFPGVYTDPGSREATARTPFGRFRIRIRQFRALPCRTQSGRPYGFDQAMMAPHAPM